MTWSSTCRREADRPRTLGWFRSARQRGSRGARRPCRCRYEPADRGPGGQVRMDYLLTRVPQHSRPPGTLQKVAALAQCRCSTAPPARCRFARRGHTRAGRRASLCADGEVPAGVVGGSTNTSGGPELVSSRHAKPVASSTYTNARLPRARGGDGCQMRGDSARAAIAICYARACSSRAPRIR